jgi:hypothetical protein
VGGDEFLARLDSGLNEPLLEDRGGDLEYRRGIVERCLVLDDRSISIGKKKKKIKERRDRRREVKRYDWVNTTFPRWRIPAMVRNIASCSSSVIPIMLQACLVSLKSLASLMPATSKQPLWLR